MTEEERIEKLDERLDSLSDRVVKIEEAKEVTEKNAAMTLTWKSALGTMVLSMVLMYFVYELLSQHLLA